MLQPSTSRRERLIIYGAENNGKTSTWLSIAAWAHRTGSPARFYVMDSDLAFNWAMDVYPNFEHNVTVYETYQWEDYQEAAAKIKEDYDPARGDWVVVDTADAAYSAIQNWYSRTILTPDTDNWMLERARQLALAEDDKSKVAARAHPLAGEWGMNWHYLNDQWDRWFQPIVQRFRGHIMFCAHEKKVKTGRDGERADDKEVVQAYEKVGVRPDGPWRMSRPFSDIMRITDNVSRGKHDRRLTTVKFKNRTEMESEPWSDFAQDYLVEVAGWKL